MKRACLYAFRSPLAQSRKMTVRTGELGGSQLRLFLDEGARDLDVIIDEDAEGELEVVDNALVEGRELRRSFLRELILVLDLLDGELHEVLVDDVADVLEVDRKRDDLHGASSVSIVKTFAGHLGHIELYRLVQAVHDVVHARDFCRKLAVVVH